MSIQLRRAEEKDARQLMALLNLDINITGSEEALFTEVDVLDYLAREDYIVFVAEDVKAQQLSGLITGRIYREYASIEFFIVEEACRNQGIGTALFDCFEKHVKSCGIGFVETMTETENRLIQNILEKRGYRKGKTFVHWFSRC